MAKNYIVQFGATTWTGLFPTFSIFKVVPGGGSTTAPGVTEIPSASGLYYFTYEPAASIAFILDSGVTALSSSRYIAGSLDPVQAVDERISEMGTTLAAIGSSLIGANAILGHTNSTFGSTMADPSTVMGYLRRALEFNEGNSLFTKTTGVWGIFARGNTVGTSLQLTSKTLADSGSIVSKT